MYELPLMASKKLSATQATKVLEDFVGGANDADTCRAFGAELAALPAGVPDTLTTAALVKLISVLGLSYIATAPAHAVAAVIAALEQFPNQPDAVFALTGLRLSADPAAELRFWLEGAGLHSTGYLERKQLARDVKNPVTVAAARAALAVTEHANFRTSRHLPLLVAEASPESLEFVTPYALRLLAQPDRDLDWFRTRVVPLFGASPAADALAQRLGVVVGAPPGSSPALAFCKALGMHPLPSTIKFTASFFGPRPASPQFPHAWQVKADSTEANWFCVRRNEKWQWRALAAPLTELKATLTDALVRVEVRSSGKNVDREKLIEWLETMLTD